MNFRHRSAGAEYLEPVSAALIAARTLHDVHRLGYLQLDRAPGWAVPILDFVVRARAIDPQVVLIRFLPGTDLAILFQSPANRGDLINAALDESLAWCTCSICGRRGRLRIRGSLEMTACRTCWRAARRAAKTPSNAED